MFAVTFIHKTADNEPVRYITGWFSNRTISDMSRECSTVVQNFPSYEGTPETAKKVLDGVIQYLYISGSTPILTCEDEDGNLGFLFLPTGGLVSVSVERVYSNNGVNI